MRQFNNFFNEKQDKKTPGTFYKETGALIPNLSLFYFFVYYLYQIAK